LDKRLWVLVLIRKLVEKNTRASNLSYENLVGNFTDGEVGKKIKALVFDEFFAKNNPDREFADFVFK